MCMHIICAWIYVCLLSDRYEKSAISHSFYGITAEVTHSEELITIYCSLVRCLHVGSGYI